MITRKLKPLPLSRHQIKVVKKATLRTVVEIEVQPNDNEGRWELWFFFKGPDGRVPRDGHFYSILGMVKAFPQLREEILAVCRNLHSSLALDFHAKLDRAIERAEEYMASN